MPEKQVHDFDNPDQGDEDEDGPKSIGDHGDQEQLSTMKYRFPDIVHYSGQCRSSSGS